MVMQAKEFRFTPDDLVTVQVGCGCGYAKTLAVPYEEYKEYQRGGDPFDCLKSVPVEDRVLFGGGLCPSCVEF